VLYFHHILVYFIRINLISLLECLLNNTKVSFKIWENAVSNLRFTFEFLIMLLLPPYFLELWYKNTTMMSKLTIMLFWIRGSRSSFKECYISHYFLWIMRESCVAFSKWQQEWQTTLPIITMPGNVSLALTNI